MKHTYVCGKCQKLKNCNISGCRGECMAQCVACLRGEKPTIGDGFSIGQAERIRVANEVALLREAWKLAGRSDESMLSASEEIERWIRAMPDDDRRALTPPVPST